MPDIGGSEKSNLLRRLDAEKSQPGAHGRLPVIGANFSNERNAPQANLEHRQATLLVGRSKQQASAARITQETPHPPAQRALRPAVGGLERPVLEKREQTSNQKNRKQLPMIGRGQSTNSLESQQPTTEEQKRVEPARQAFYQRTRNGDIVVYDSRCQLQAFQDSHSTLLTDIELYEDLDREALRTFVQAQTPLYKLNQSHQYSGADAGTQMRSSLGAVSKASLGRVCNEVYYAGGRIELPENDVLLGPIHGGALPYDAEQGLADQERLSQLLAQHRQQKTLTNFEHKLVIPPASKKFDVKFYSRFECGNLLRAIKVPIKPELTFSGVVSRGATQAKAEYDLYLDVDTSTDGHMHWFYFMVMASNLEKGSRIRVNIRNLVRGKSLYQEGMLPRILYADQSELPSYKQKGWHVDPNVTADLKFYSTDQNINFDKEFQNKDRTFATLSFVYVVQELDESAYFAYDRPYTYSKDLQPYLERLIKEPKYHDYLQAATLCRTLGGTECRFLTITEGVSAAVNYYELLDMARRRDGQDMADIQRQVTSLTVEELEDENVNQRGSTGTALECRYYEYLAANIRKRAVLIAARVHPGEGQASFSLEGMVDYLLSDAAEVVEMRKNYIFYVVPMLNIDGVIFGNQRTNLAGFDLNRRWAEPSPYLSPVLFAFKKLARLIEKEREIDIFCDMHGHFQPMGTFMYCNSHDRGSGVPPDKLHQNAGLRVIPHLLTLQNRHFQIKNSTFSMEAYKSASAR